MNRQEAAAMLAYATRLDPRIAPTNKAEADDRLAQWCELLADVPGISTTGHGWDVARIIREHIASSPYPILPADIARKWHAYKRDALSRHTDQRPNVDPDDEAAYRAALAQQRHAIATGQAAPSTHRELTAGGPAPEVAARLKLVGRYIPDEARAALAPYRPAAAAREAAIRAGQPDALAVRCDWCKAPPGEPCRARRHVPGGGATSNRPRITPHPSRIDAAIAHQATQESA